MRYFCAFIIISFIFITSCSQSSEQQGATAQTSSTLPEVENQMATLKITSPAFAARASIPSRYTCDGANINPEIHIEDIPKGTKSLALIVDDPDAPSGTWTHWIVFDIPADTLAIDENSVPGKQGTNDFKKTGYGGPCPPSGSHRYFFRVFALDTMLNHNTGASRRSVESAMEGHIIAKGELVGLYKRKA